MIRTIVAVTFALATLAGFATVVAAAQDKPQAPAPAATPALNLNTATLADLEKLPGVGPSTAKQILEYRQKNNGFRKVEELMNIKGIGEKSFLKLKPLVTVVPPKVEKRA